MLSSYEQAEVQILLWVLGEVDWRNMASHLPMIAIALQSLALLLPEEDVCMLAPEGRGQLCFRMSVRDGRA